MAIFLKDSFDKGAESNLTGHTVSGAGATGGAWALQQLQGGSSYDNFNFNGGNDKIYSTASPASCCQNAATPTSEEYYVKGDLYHYQDDASITGLCARMAAGEDARMYQFVHDNSANLWRLRKVSADGTVSNLGAGSGGDYSQTLSNDTTYLMEMRVTGTTTTTIKGYVAGVERCTYDDSSTPITAAGKAGVWSGPGGSAYLQIADIEAGDIAAPPPPGDEIIVNIMA